VVYAQKGEKHRIKADIRQRVLTFNVTVVFRRPTRPGYHVGHEIQTF
jgi:hypothetical protein